MLLFLSQNQLDFVYKTFTFFGWSSHTILLSFFSLDLIWALSISLAATLKIEFFLSFSSGYLDVSVHQLFPLVAMYLQQDTWGLLKWVSPFGYSRINGYLLLPETFRSLSRPSSALSAKAFTLCPWSLDRNIFLFNCQVSNVVLVGLGGTRTLRPHAYQACALTSWATGPYSDKN